MKVNHLLDRLEFNNHLPFNDQVESLTDQLHAFVPQSYRHLLFNSNPLQPKLVNQSLFVDALKQAGPQNSMDLNGASDDSFTQPIQGFRKFPILHPAPPSSALNNASTSAPLRDLCASAYCLYAIALSFTGSVGVNSRICRTMPSGSTRSASASKFRINRCRSASNATSRMSLYET